MGIDTSANVQYLIRIQLEKLAPQITAENINEIFSELKFEGEDLSYDFLDEAFEKQEEFKKSGSIEDFRSFILSHKYRKQYCLIYNYKFARLMKLFMWSDVGEITRTATDADLRRNKQSAIADAARLGITEDFTIVLACILNRS